MINYSQLPAWWFDHCLGFYEMKYIGQRYEMYLIPLQGFISFQSHFYFIPTQLFISLSFLLYFILTQLFISLSAQDNIFGVSLLAQSNIFGISLLFHWLPRATSLVFHCCFIVFLGQYHWYFIAVSLPALGHIIGIFQWDVGVVTWPITQNAQKTKIVALHCSFLNLVELCSEVLPLWRYDVEDRKSVV